MKPLKYIAIAILIILIILLIALGAVTNKKEQKNSTNTTIKNNIANTNTLQEEQIIDPPIEPDYNIKLLEDRDKFYSIEKNVSTYLLAVVEKDTETIYNLLDEDYAEKYGVTKENILEKVEDFKIPLSFKAQTIYEVQKPDSQITTYYIEGYIEEQINGEAGNMQEYSLTLNFDEYNDTFSVMPFKYMFGNLIDYENENSQIKVKTKQYISYMDKVEILLIVENKTNEKIDISKEASLTYYEGDVTTNIISKQGEIVEGLSKNEVILSFDNNIQTPKNINILEMEIPIIKNQDEKN